MKRKITFSQSINESTSQLMRRDKKVIVLGLGVEDPKGVFGTLTKLKKKFKNQIFEMPTCESSFTGFALGLALSKKKVIVTHQRVEFSLISIEQIFNQIAKWFYMSGGKSNVPIVIRLIIGKGWGQGPLHSQSLETIFSHIPGLKVIAPSNAYNVKGLLNSAVADPDPVIFFEHRWLHETTSYVPKKTYFLPLNKSIKIQNGKDLTIISYSLSTLSVIKCLKIFKNNNISVEVIDLISLRPIDKTRIINSAKKTRKVLIVDNGMIEYGISAEISALINENIKRKILVKRIGVIGAPIASSRALAQYSYPELEIILKETSKIMKKSISYNKNDYKRNFDQPDKDFKGPF